MRKLFIENISVPTDQEWDIIWKECHFSTYFHSREWAEIWNGYTNGKIYPEPKLIHFSDGKKALMPLSVKFDYKGLVKTHVSSPMGTFGGYITTDKLINTHSNLVIDYLIKEYSNLRINLNPYDDHIVKLNVPSAFYDETYALDLSKGFDEAYKKWHPSQRSKVNQAKRAGIIIELADSLEDWNSYYEVYEDTLRKWGKKATAKYEKKLFKELHDQQSPFIKLWLAIHDKKIIAGKIVFYSKRHVVSWHDASLEKYLRLRAGNLLMYEVAKDAAEKNYNWFDLNPCGGHEGVRTYKRGFGPIELTFPVINIESRKKKILSKAYRFVRKVDLLGLIKPYG